MPRHLSDAKDAAMPGVRMRSRSALPQNGMLMLQAAAGNRAVASLFVQRQADGEEVSPAELGISPQDLVDSEPAAGGGEGAVGVQRKVDAEDSARIQRSAEAEVVQRAPGTCAAYNGYSAALSLASYNCAGLAHRSYDYKSLAATKAALGAGNPAAGAPAGQIKHWLWEYDLHAENSSGARSSSVHDFHTVAGEIGPGGAEPTEVYSKNGRRQVYGPSTGPGFRPAAREQARENDAREKLVTDPKDGKPIFTVRENFAESTFAMPCPSTGAPIQGPPSP